jgi:hypothetical protein
MQRLVLVLVAALAACGTPQDQCINRNTRDLRVVDRLIAETEGNLERGYALETVTRFRDYWGTCLDRVVVGNQVIAQPRMCLREVAYTEERPKAINLEAEAEKLEGLKAKRTELARTAAPLVAQCKVDFPE